MQEFKTSFNFLVPLFRISFVVTFALVCIFIFKGELLKLILIAGAAVWAALSTFLSGTKTYRFTPSYFEEKNYLSFSTESFDLSEIRGFSTSVQSYRFWDFDQIILYMEDGKKILLTQHTYFNFKQIEPALLALNYTYFGHEPFTNEFGKGRNFRFDK